MTDRDWLEETGDGEDIVGLKLTVPERDAILTSSKVLDRDLQNRVRSAPPKQIVTFHLEELEDLHRGLAIDADQTLDSKRRRTIRKVMRKIEELLEDSDESEYGFGNFWDNDFEELELSATPSADELFQSIIGASAEGNGGVRCCIKLNAEQRTLLCGMDSISADIHKLMREGTPAELEIELSSRQFLTAMLALAEAIGSASDKKQRRLFEQTAQRFADVTTATAGPACGKSGSFNGPQAVAYQLKITLAGSKPAIWRRVVVPDCTLGELHATIQAAMGWTNSHLHMFEYRDDRFSDPRFELEAAEYDESQVYLSQLVDDGCKKLRYEYDFGDDWMHTIQIEKSLDLKPEEKLPKCIKGAGACPPEDCGGVWGYQEFLEAIRDPKHKQHEEMVEWAGEDFDPNHFDLEVTNKVLTEGLPYGFAED